MSAARKGADVRRADSPPSGQFFDPRRDRAVILNFTLQKHERGCGFGKPEENDPNHSL